MVLLSIPQQPSKLPFTRPSIARFIADIQVASPDASFFNSCIILAGRMLLGKKKHCAFRPPSGQRGRRAEQYPPYGAGDLPAFTASNGMPELHL